MLYSNEAILAMAKAAITTDDLAAGGLLSPEDAAAFITSLVDQSAVLKAARMEPMVSNEKRIDIYSISSRQLRKKEEARSPQQRGSITTGRNVLKSIKTMLPIEIADETFENNIEGEAFEDRLIGSFTLAVGNDMTDLAVNGDVADVSADAAFLTTNDGWIKLGKARAHVHDTGVSTDYPAIFKAMLKLMPNKFKVNIEALRFLCSSNVEIEYRSGLSARDTSLGDAYLDANRRSRFMGVLVEPVEYWPDGVIMLTQWVNLVYGVRFGIKLERDKDIFAGLRQFAITMETDFEFGMDDAIVIGYNAP